MEKANNWVRDGTSLASFSEVSYSPVQDIALNVGYNFIFGEDINYLQNVLGHMAIGIELLAQVHLWFRKGGQMRLMVIGIVAVLLFSGAVQAQELKNVQVLPFTSTHEIVPFMKNMAKDLGVKCNYCHNMKDKSLDEIKHKLIAREMMRMVKLINSQMDSISNIATAAGMDHWKEASTLECWVCHRGATSPETSRPK